MASGSSTVPLDNDAVRIELERVLSSETFASAGRLSRLLRFVVERTLDGRGDEIKEYVLGVEVFDRGTEYDPRLDSIVRVEARRLRTKLDEYYASTQDRPAVFIRLKRGSYVPFFEAPSPAAAATGLPTVEAGPAPGRGPAARPAIGSGRRSEVWLALAATMVGIVVMGIYVAQSPTPMQAGTLPRIAVLPFSHYPADAATASIAERLTDGVATELVRLGRVEVISRLSTRQFAAEPRNASALAHTLGVGWLVEARVDREGDGVRLSARVVDAPRDRKVWVDEFTRGADALRDLEREAAAAIHAAVQAARADARQP
jgi:TolB-like protein